MKESVKNSNQNPGGKRSFPHGRTILILTIAALVWAASPPVRAALREVSGDYAIQFIEPPPDTTEIWFVFINEKGNVVMQYFTEPAQGEAQGHTAILQNGAWTVIDVPGSYWCGASNPNASGRVGMVYVQSPEDDAAGIWHNVIYDRGTYTPLPDHPIWQYGIQEINDHGLMTGVAFAPDGNYRYYGVLMNASLSVFKVFDVPGSDRTVAFGINNAGWIVGPYRSVADGKAHGFLSHLGDSFSYIEVPGATGGTWPFGINNKGEIAGMYAGDDDVLRGFLLRQGKFGTFVIPETEFNTIDWIVDNGNLSGNCVRRDGKPYGYIARTIAGRN